MTFEALAHYRCYVIALYKSAFTYLLTYLLRGRVGVSMVRVRVRVKVSVGRW